MALREAGRYGFLMESAAGGEQFGRYSLLGIDPVRELISPRAGCAFWSDAPDKNELSLSECLTDYLGTRAQVTLGMFPFTGGLVGFIGFDFVREIESLPVAPTAEQTVAWLGDYQSTVIFDHVKQEIAILSTHGQAAEHEIGRLHAALTTPISSASRRFTAGERSSNFTQPAFCAAVESMKKHIVAGDIFQGVLSQRFTRPCSGDPFQLYRALRRVNPSPYMFYQETPVGTFVGASPELLVGVRAGIVRLLPIAGTRPRGDNETSDLAHERALLADPKERAEHMMLVDLARNDLGRVADYGSVRVDETAAVHRFSHVMHLVSRVSGKLRPDQTAVDALRASFPAGTVSGAPKVRALELILEHEPTPRGFYAGAAGFLSAEGNAEFCITLRTARIHDGMLEYQAGAGIVADSDPVSEYNETLHKARALERALELAAAS
jgi:anthranilate synthase component 1